MQTAMTVKGQVTIPKSVRDAAGIGPGSRIEVSNNERGEIVVRAVDRDTDFERRYREPLEPFEQTAYESGRPLEWSSSIPTS